MQSVPLDRRSLRSGNLGRCCSVAIMHADGCAPGAGRWRLVEFQGASDMQTPPRKSWTSVGWTNLSITRALSRCVESDTAGAASIDCMRR